MSDSIVIKIYTKVDFYLWIIKGKDLGLNDKIISRNRAIAQMNNPDAKEDDILLTTANFNGLCVGYRGVFPEEIHYIDKRIKVGWLSTFFIDPKFRGRNIAKMLMGPIEEYYKNGIGAINSSDKAVNPTNVMGTSKLMAERIITSANANSPNTIFSSTRFGNVLGSSGSVVPIFIKQILEGGPIGVYVFV